MDMILVKRSLCLMHYRIVLKTGGTMKDYFVRRGSAFVNEYARVDPVSGQRYDGGPGNPNHLLGTFPTLFPYGLGAFEIERKENVPYEVHVRWALQYVD